MKKSTLFNHVHQQNEAPEDGREDLEMSLEESEFFEQYAPSDESVSAILAFAASYFPLKSKFIDEMSMILN